MDTNEFNDLGVEDLGVRVTEDVEVDAEKAPPLSSAEFALRNSLKIMDGKYGGSFNVRFVLDDVQKHGWLELLIAYPDDTVKSVFLFKNAFRQTDTESSGVYHIPEKKATRIYSFDEDYEGCDFNFTDKFETPNMPIPARALWNKIREHYREIPIVKIYKASPLTAIYLDMEKLAATYAKAVGFGFMDTEESFSVSTKDFRTIATRHGWEPSDLKVEFDKAGLFIKDKVAGYQKSKRVGEQHLHFYVFRKTLPSTDEDVTSLEDTEYTTNKPSQVERLKASYEAQLNKLRTEIQSSIKEHRPPRPESSLL